MPDDVFASRPFEGNQLAVFPDARLRIFTPGREMPKAGRGAVTERCNGM